MAKMIPAESHRTPRHPKAWARTPAKLAPNSCPSSVAATNRLIASWRSENGMRSPIRANPIGTTPAPHRARQNSRGEQQVESRGQGRYGGKDREKRDGCLYDERLGEEIAQRPQHRLAYGKGQRIGGRQQSDHGDRRAEIAGDRCHDRIEDPTGHRAGKAAKGNYEKKHADLVTISGLVGKPLPTGVMCSGEQAVLEAEPSNLNQARLLCGAGVDAVAVCRCAATG